MTIKFTSIKSVQSNLNLFAQLDLDHMAQYELSRVRNGLVTESQALTFLNKLINN